ncbi:hypothetical protein BHE74_00027159, partial [Ensete ventricosum]
VDRHSFVIWGRTAEALALMWSCFNVDSTMTARRLVDVKEHYYVPPKYELHVPLPGQRPYDAFSSGFGLSIDALEAGLRFPLHPVIEACLERWHISPSQMVPNSFSTEWTSRKVNNSVSVLSDNEPELVEILWGILSASRGVRDMNKAWLAEAGLSSAPREMFNLGRIKSGDSANSGSAAPSTTSASPIVEVAISMAEKRLGTSEDANLRKRSKMVAFEQPACAAGSTTKAPTKKGKEPAGKGKEPAGKGKEPAEVKFLSEGYSLRDLCEVEDRARANGYFASIMKHPSPGEGEELLTPRWSSIPGQPGCGSKGARDNRARLEEDVLSLTEAAALLEKELKAEGPKAAKHPEVEVEAEANPFAECPEDDNVTMDLCQPFDDNTPAEK